MQDGTLVVVHVCGSKIFDHKQNCQVCFCCDAVIGLCGSFLFICLHLCVSVCMGLFVPMLCFAISICLQMISLCDLTVTACPIFITQSCGSRLPPDSTLHFLHKVSCEQVTCTFFPCNSSFHCSFMLSFYFFINSTFRRKSFL